MTGVNPDNVIGKKCWEVFLSSLCHTSECRLQHILNGEQRIQVEIERKKCDGTVIPCVVTTFSLKDDGGNIIGIMEQFRDITEIRHKDKEIKESEDRYRALIELGTEAGEAIVMLQDVDGKEGLQTFFNDRWPKIVGYTKRELLGTSFFDLLSDQDREASIERHRLKMSGKNVLGMYEISIVRRDGTKVIVELTGASTNFQGKRANVIYLRDITSKKHTELKIRESEELYRSLFQNVPVAIEESDYSQVKLWFDQLKDNGVVDFSEFFLDPSNLLPNLRERIRTSRLNDQTLRLWDVSSVDEYIDCFLPQSGKCIKVPGYRQCLIGLATGKTYFDYEESIITKKGNKKCLHTWVSVAPGCESSLSKVDICFIDMTERKKTEDMLNAYQNNLQNIVDERTRELIEVNNQLQEQIRQRIEFTRALVHELKTPLTPLLGASEALSEDLKQEPYQSYAASIFRGANQLSKRIEELLDVAKGEIGMLKLNCQLIEPLPLLNDVINDVRPETKRRNQILSTDLPVCLRLIYADPERLKQILLNLLTNAFKFTYSGGSISLKAFERNDYLVIEVVDNGMGIDSKTQESLFKPYQQADDDRMGGLGLGLFLCKLLVELHKGNIEVESEKGQGTKVLVSFPLNDSVVDHSLKELG
jgi:PAS domain S-box-containing protein